MALAGDVFIASEIGRLLQLDASKASDDEILDSQVTVFIAI